MAYGRDTLCMALHGARGYPLSPHCRQADTTTVAFRAEGLRIDRWTFDVGHLGSPLNDVAEEGCANGSQSCLRQSARSRHGEGAAEIPLPFLVDRPNSRPSVGT